MFVFPGQGAQWVGMGGVLLESSPVFAGEVGACAEALGAFVDWPVLDVLRGVPGAPGLDRVEVVQPALFAVMVGLAALWRSCGVEPAAVVGHSQGEIAAAYVAGALSLEDAARVVALRSRALAGLAGGGGMASVELPEQAVARRLGRWDGRLCVAAVNGAASVVVSGEAESLDELVAECLERGERARRIAVDYASHSAFVEPVRDELEGLLAPVRPRAAGIALWSTVDGGWADGAGLDGRYWYRNLREPVRFGSAVRGLLADGYGVFVEASAHPVLRGGVEQEIEAAGAEAAAVGSLRRDDGGLDRFLASVAEAHACGAAVDWAAVLGAPGGRRVDLPTYAFQRERFWPGRVAGRAVGLPGAGLRPVDHLLLGAGVELPETGGFLFTGRLSLRDHRWIGDHVVAGAVLLPGTAFVEMALQAGDQVGCGRLEELTLEAPLVVPDRGGVQVQVVVGGAGEAGAREFTVHARREADGPEALGDGGGGTWVRHGGGVLVPDPGPAEAGPGLGEWPPVGADRVDLDDYYDRLADGGLGYGPAFRGLRAAWRRGDEVFAEVRLPEELRAEAGRCGVHPALLDAALHALGAGRPAPGGTGPLLPFSWQDVRLSASGAVSLRVRVAPVDGGMSVMAADEAGGPVASVGSLVLRPASAGSLAGARHHDALYHLEWVAAAVPASAAPGWAVLAPARRAVPGGEDASGLAALAARAAVPPVVLVACVGDAGAGQAAGARRSAGELLATLQAWLAEPRFGDSRLVVVTCGAVDIDGQVDDLACAPLWGLVRSAQAENPGRFVLADVDDDTASWAALPAALGLDEPQLAVRRGTVRVPRLRRGPGPALEPPDATPHWRLDTRQKGTLQNLQLLPCPEAAAPLAPGQVRVAVRAAGLNFRDVLSPWAWYDQENTRRLRRRVLCWRRVRGSRGWCLGIG